MRINYLDYLRILAIFFVIVVHVSAQNWYTTDVKGFSWQTFNFYDSIARCGVPLFVMISGCLFLNKEIKINLIYNKYVKRMLIAFLFWGTFYCGSIHQDVLTNIKNILTNKYHMWFILVIIGLYITLPIIKEITKNKKNMEYFLILAVIFSFFLPWIYKLTHDFGSKDLIVFIDLINGKIQQMTLRLVLGWTSYFILGYYINTVDLNKRQRAIIYFCGFLGFILTILLQSILAIKIEDRHQHYYDCFSINVLLCSIALFVFFKYASFSNLSNSKIVKISECSFGIYLIHIFILEQLKSYGINTLSFNPIISVPVIACIVYVISLAISALLNSVPTLKKYIV